MGRKQKVRKMSQVDAMKVWQRPDLTNAKALKKMKGWTPSAAYRWLGRRGLPPGRREMS